MAKRSLLSIFHFVVMNMPQGEQHGSTLALFMCGWSCSIPDEKCSSYQRVRPLDQKMILRLNFARVTKKGYHLKKQNGTFTSTQGTQNPQPTEEKKTNKNWTGLENALWFMGGHALFKSCTLSRICVISRNANSRMDGIGSFFGDDAPECLFSPHKIVEMQKWVASWCWWWCVRYFFSVPEAVYDDGASDSFAKYTQYGA